MQRSAIWRARLKLVALQGRAVPVMEDSDRILDQATDWLLALTEKPDDRTVRAQFQHWLAEDSRHAAVWNELNTSYDLIGETEPETADQWQSLDMPVHGAHWRQQRDRSRREAAVPLRRLPKRRIAAVVAATALAVWLAPDAMVALRADYRTGTGELRMVRLEDGSTAQLGPGSAIKVRYAEGERRVDLLAGEALFQVKPNMARPFRVHADEVQTTVLGTGFDVRRLASATEVGVQHGRVRVDRLDSQAGSYILAAGDQLSIVPDGEARSDHAAPQLVASWALGEVNARDRRVADVIEDIRPWYRGKIIVMGSALADRRINGVYDPRDAGKAIRSMVLPLGGTVTQITPWIIVVRG
ncbi:FecR domain-containing protein [Novosphingobium sp. BL-8H]|uniref:FecR family protein n=1 Tax=Novosphingobium sp. BL-8H TaxID=3127640 RepID=UPI0037575706